MRLVKADLEQFRNLVTQTVDLHPHYNLLVGKNGQGKTNFLEAIGFLGTLRDHQKRIGSLQGVKQDPRPGYFKVSVFFLNAKGPRPIP